jgi:hypothetical protein
MVYIIFLNRSAEKIELSNFDLLSEHLKTANELNSVKDTTSGTIQKNFKMRKIINNKWLNAYDCVIELVLINYINKFN